MEYFAREAADILADYLDGQITDWNSQLTKNGLKLKWQKCYYSYYGRHWKTGSYFQDNDIAKLGLQGELQGLTINDFRNLIKHMLVLTTNQKISYEPRATNTDDASLTQTRLAKIIIDYYAREKKVNRFLHDCAELSYVLSKAFIKCTWDKQLGKPHDIQRLESGEEIIVYDGDVRIRLKDPFQVYVDQTLESWSDVQWTADIEWVNRWDQIAQHPELKEKILAVPTKDQQEGISYINSQPEVHSDLIAVKEFYHLRTPSMPSGRYVRYINKDIILYDGPIPYKKLPIFMMTPGKWYGSTEGYSESFDLLNLSQAQNILWSSVFTNQAAFGVQNILIPEGANLNTYQMGQGLQGLRYNPAAGKPEPLQLTKSPPEIFKMMELLGTKMETVFGLNSISRGQVNTDMSGKAMGLLQSMSIQYASAFQQSYAETAEELGTFILQLIQSFAKTERMASIVGKFNKMDMVKFTGDDISGVERVVVDLQNPYLATTQGRDEVATRMLEAGFFKDNPQQYLVFRETGNYEVMTQAPMSKMSLVTAENEDLQQGKPVIIAMSDPHLLHIQEHLTLVSRPDIRRNSQYLELIMNHVQEHYNLYNTQPPIFAQINGEPPSPMSQMMPPPVPGAEPPPGPQQGNPEPVHQEPVPAPPQPDQALEQSLR